MNHILPLLNATNTCNSKRKHSVKSLPTCTISLTNVSSCNHPPTSPEPVNLVPFPAAPASIPFPSTSGSPPKQSNVPLRFRSRTQSASLRRRRSFIRLIQPPPPDPCPLPPPMDTQFDYHSDLISSTPRKRARKSSMSCPSPCSSTPTSTSSSKYHSLSISAKRNKSSKRASADLKFMCTVYRSVAWMRVQRELSSAAGCTLNCIDQPSTEMDCDLDFPSPGSSLMDVQESLLLSRMRSFLIFNDMNPRWLNVEHLVAPIAKTDDADVDMEQPSSVSSSHSAKPSPAVLSPEQLAASLLLRFRNRTKKARPEAAVGEFVVKTRKRSPLAGSEASRIPNEPYQSL